MTGIDKYSLVSFAPSLLVVAVCIGLAVFGVRQLRKNIARDAAAAQVRDGQN